MKYVLTYKQPHEEDYDSGPGIGDHVIEYAEHTTTFDADGDVAAWAIVKTFLSEESIIFDHFIDGDGKTYCRQLVILERAATKVECDD